MITLTLDILPLPWKAPYVGSRGAYSPRYNEAKIVKAMIREAYQGSLILGDIYAILEFFFPIPKSVSKKKRVGMMNGTIRPRAGGDLTNCVKWIEDLMQEIVYENDKQVVTCHASKWYAEKPSIRIQIQTL